MRIVDGSVEHVAVTAGERFALSLPASPLGGYLWQAEVDGRHLALEEQAFSAHGPAIGGWGVERLVFRALLPGECQVALACQRPWEAEPRERRTVTVSIAAADADGPNAPAFPLEGQTSPTGEEDR